LRGDAKRQPLTVLSAAWSKYRAGMAFTTRGTLTWPSLSMQNRISTLATGGNLTPAGMLSFNLTGWADLNAGTCVVGAKRK